MKIWESDNDRLFQTSRFERGRAAAACLVTVKPLLKASLLCVAFSAATLANAQDSIAMVDRSAVSVSGSQVAPVAVAAAVQSLENDAAASTRSTSEQEGKSPITGLEPGTLALIGFGLLALAATRRNAR
ncbi:MAG: hypothetical protein AB8B48_03375 [Pseudomonadales bacterium]